LRGCHSDGTPYYRDCEEDIQMYVTLPLLGVDNGNAVSENSVDNSRALTYAADMLKSNWLRDEVHGSNLRTSHITFDNEMVSNFYSASWVSFQCTRFFI
jgi:hypothetical protein